MPKKKTAPTDNVVLRIPFQLQQDIIDLIDSEKSEYRNFSDFINGALRKEVDWQRKKIDALTVEISAEVEPPARR